MRLFSRTSDDDRGRLSKAAQCLLFLEEGEGSSEDSAGAFRWVLEDQRNLRAFRRIRAFRTWLLGLDKESKSALARELIPEAMRVPRWRRPQVMRWTYAAAAAVLLGTLGLSFVLNRHVPATNPVSREYSTARAATRTIALPDGTRITLAGESEIRVAYQAHRREVTLDRGEAYFEVHHDAARPFIVQAGTLRVEDLGTVFDVRKSRAEVTVSVAHGRVKVHQETSGRDSGIDTGHSTSASATPVRVGAGHQVTAVSTSGALQIMPIGGADVASWRHGRLRFEDTPLSTVVERLNRFSTVPISLADKRIGARRFTGTIFVNNIRDWLHAASAVFHLREEHRANGAIVLHAAAPSTRGGAEELSPLTSNGP